MIKLDNIDFFYGHKSILQNISLSVDQGEFVCLLGESGCGKSTLLRLIAGLNRPREGAISIDGNPVDGPEKKCAVVFQDYSLFPWMSTLDNLVLAIKSAFPDKSTPAARVLGRSYLELVGLGTAAAKYPAQLSGGMRQRAAIARALAIDPEILLLDEPFGALDPLNRAILQDLLLTLWRDPAKKRTVVFVTHDVEEAIYLGSRLVVLSSSPGRIIADRRMDKNPALNRQQLFETPEIKALYQQLIDIYRHDVLQKLEFRSLQDGGGGI